MKVSAVVATIVVAAAAGAVGVASAASGGGRSSPTVKSRIAREIHSGRSAAPAGAGSQTAALSPVPPSGSASGSVLGANPVAPAGLALMGSSGAVGWGENELGQLGNGTNTGSAACGLEGAGACTATAGAVSGLSGVTALAGDEYHSLALLAEGTVMAWGDNSSGQLGDGTTTGPETCNPSGIACSKVPIAVSGLGEAAGIAAGHGFSLALLKNGTVRAWGDNAGGELGDGGTTSSDVPVTVSGLSEVAAVSAGGGHALALLKNGTVMAWGANRNGELGNGSTAFSSDVPVPVSGLSEVAAIAAGDSHSLALLKNGTVMAWGANDAGQLGDGTSTGPETCEELGGNMGCSRTPVPVSGLGEITAIAAGGCGSCGPPRAHSLAVLKGGGVEAWGANPAGQLGDGTTTGPETCKDTYAEFGCARTPVPVSGLTEAIAVSAGFGCSLALNRAGTISSWGGNAFGQLGNGTNTSSDVPVAVAGLANVSTVSAGDHFGLAVGTLLNLPTITKVEPDNGPAPGGTSVTITGTHFTGATAVKFGSANASFTVDSETSITAVSPPGTGAAEISVTTPVGTNATTPAATFDYAPTVTAVEPNYGLLAGGTQVNITGTNFTGATGVKFGSSGATSFTVNSSTSITAVSPSGAAPGLDDISVTTPGGTSPMSSADKFAYGPNVTQIFPGSGPNTGGTAVTITGINFTGASEVKFGSQKANFTVDSPTTITASAPPEAELDVVPDITVTTPEGTSPTTEADGFRYIETTGCEAEHPPVVNSVEPHSGPAGTSVVIKGERFFYVCGDVGSSTKRVFFGDAQASFKGGAHEGEIIATAPPGSGTVDVRVEGLLTGVSAVSRPFDTFTYAAPSPPAVAKVEPNHGPAPGGTSVTITGTNLTGATAVKFGSTNATSFTVNPTSSITATAPAGVGPVDVTVETSSGTSSTSPADHFTYAPTYSMDVEPSVLGDPPAGIAANSEGDVWVSSWEMGTVQEFKETGEPLRTIGPLQSPCTGSLEGPFGLAVDGSSNLWVTDLLDGRIRKFSPEGKCLLQLGSEGSGSGQFKHPRGIAVDSHGNLWISDTGNDRLQELSGEGAFVRQVGPALGDGSTLAGPGGPAIDSHGHIWVPDIGHARVVELGESGEYLGQIGQTSTSGCDPLMCLPMAAAVDSAGNVLIADYGHSRVDQFGAGGELLNALGVFGSGSGQFEWPLGVALDTKGNLWLSDWGNGRLDRWTGG